MTRGNQRELAREKNMKKMQSSNKKASDSAANAGLSAEQRKLRDAERMRLKQKEAEEKRAAEAAGTSK
jgi:hypothetical protein